MKRLVFFLPFVFFAVPGIAQQKSPADVALRTLLNDTSLKNAHVGICIYDPAAKKYVYQYQHDKYFVPASNTKIFTTYAALKYLGNLLTGIRYYENDTAIYLLPTGDPTLLHRDFTRQPVVDFLKLQNKKIYITDQNWKDKELGKGWSWDDYTDEYMTERSALPVYGNTIKWVQEKVWDKAGGSERSMSFYSDPEVSWKVGFDPDPLEREFKVRRDRLSNNFQISEGIELKKELYVPFITNGLNTALELLADTVHRHISVTNTFQVPDTAARTIFSQPLDSVLRPMMYRSDNFFAEQLLLMVSEERFGVLDANMAIDSLLAKDLGLLPQQPVWVDGSGLSRYNLFSPADFVAVLDSMRLQFGMARLKSIFPSADSGTLKGYFRSSPSSIYAKTGSMSGVMALSGYLYTKNNRLLIFSVLVNNFSGKVTPVKRAVERFLSRARN